MKFFPISIKNIQYVIGGGPLFNMLSILHIYNFFSNDSIIMIVLVWLKGNDCISCWICGYGLRTMSLSRAFKLKEKEDGQS